MRSSDGGDLKRLTKNPYEGHDIPTDYDPDGSRLAFGRDNPLKVGEPFATFVVNADGTDLHRITPWRLDAGGAGWFPDGTRLVFSSKGAIFLMDPDGGNKVKIHEGTGGG
jgi:Tol biopolymer transport system component